MVWLTGCLADIFFQNPATDVANGAPLRTLGGFGKVTIAPTTAAATTTTLNVSISASAFTIGNNNDTNSAVSVLAGDVAILLGHFSNPMDVYNLTLY